MTIYHLVDWNEPTPAARPDANYGAYMEAARAQLVADRFRYDGATGLTYDSDGLQSRYSSASSWEPGDDTREAADHTFTWAIRARAARMYNRAQP